MRMDAYRHVQELELAYFEDRTSGGLMAVLNDDVNQLERFLDVGANQMILTISNVVLVGLAFFVISPAARVPRLPADPGDRGRVAAATRRRSSRGTTPCGRPPGASPTRSPTTSAASPPSRPSPPRSARSSGSRSTAGPTATPTREAIRSRAPSSRSSAWRSSPASPSRSWSVARAVLNGDLEVGALRHARVHDPAAAVAAHRARRDARPLPAGDGVVPPHLRAARRSSRASGPATRDLRRAGARRGALRRRDASPTATGADVLHGLDLEIPAGETHAIVGATGAGKSTVVKLLLRLYEPTGGPDLHRRRADRRAHLPARCAARWAS